MRHLHNFLAGTATLIGLCTAPHTRAQTEASPALRDQVAVVVNDATLDASTTYCEQHAPEVGTRLRRAHTAWRERQRVEQVRGTLSAIQPQVLARVASQASGVQALMAREGQAHAVCEQVLASLAGPAMDLQARYPAAYRAPTPGTEPAQRSTARGSVAPDRPVGTVITPAQLAVMLDGARQVKDRQEALRAAGLTGRLYIRGTWERRGQSHYVDQRQEGFRSRIYVSPDTTVVAQEGQEVVVSGVLKTWPSGYASLKDSHQVADASGLVPSSLPEAAGLARIPVPAAQVRTAPGQGVPLADVHGVFYRYYYLGSEYQEEATLLFKDGWAYMAPELPPADLDKARSRSLEPQRWWRWQAAGQGKLRLQEHDDRGQPKGAWLERSGTVYGPWPAGSTLQGHYNSKRFYGSLALGGTYFENGYSFQPAGRFEGSKYSQSGSGTVAVTLNGFSAGGTSHSDGRGTSSSAGGGNEGVAVATRSRRDDGAEHRGSYRFDGYTLELRYDSGQVGRLFSYPHGSDRIGVGDLVYSKAKPN